MQRVSKPADSVSFIFGPNITWAALDYGHIKARIKAANARADVQLAQNETRTATSLVAIYKALGGGWEIEHPVARTASTR
jgi:outer membrane protein TolC